MARDADLRAQGEVLDVLPNATYRIRLETGRIVTGHLGGQLRLHVIRILPGDTVTVELMPQDLSRGRIVVRGK